MELNRIKLDPEFEKATKAKKMAEYERINELLNKKVEWLTQENIDLIEKNMSSQDKLSLKED